MYASSAAFDGVQSRLKTNRLLLNASSTKFLPLRTPKQHKNFDRFKSLKKGASFVELADAALNLDIVYKISETHGI